MKSPYSKAEVETFVQQWLVRHLPSQFAPANQALEIDRLAAHLTSDARASGITGGDIHRAVGDIDDYLVARCHPEAA